MSFQTYEEALDYAVKGREDLDVMVDPKTGEFHVIRVFALNHWKQHYRTVAEVRMKVEVRDLRQT